MIAERALTLDPSCTPRPRCWDASRPPAKQRVGDDLAARTWSRSTSSCSSRCSTTPAMCWTSWSSASRATRCSRPSGWRWRRRPRSRRFPAKTPPARLRARSRPTPAARLEPAVARVGVGDRREVTDPGTHGDLGIAYKQMGLYDAAIGEFTALATDNAPRGLRADDDRRVHRGQGGPRRGGGQVQAGAEPAASSRPLNRCELYYLLGAVFERLGDISEALYFFENLSKRDARFRDVGQRITTLQTQEQARRA